MSRLNLTVMPLPIPIGDETTWVHVNVDGEHAVSFRATGVVVFDHYLFEVESIKQQPLVVDVSLVRKYKKEH